MPRLLTGVAGADGLAMLRDALKMGASVVGGCPDLDPDPTGYVEAVLEVASEHGCPVDLHTDAADPTRLARLAAVAGGMRPGVTLGPCGGLGRLPADTVTRIADRLATADVTVVCLPQGGCGGVDRRGTAPVRLLRTAGVQVAAGSGALRDVSNPVGRGDPLEAAYLLASRHGMRPEDAYDTVSSSARAALGLPRCGSRRDFRPNCSRCGATGSRARCRWRTAGSWCTGGAWWHGRVRCGSTATLRRARVGAAPAGTGRVVVSHRRCAGAYA